MADPFRDLDLRDPYRLYRTLRRETPVFPLSTGPSGPEFLLTRHTDVETVVRDDRFSVNRLRATGFRSELEGLPEDLQADRQAPSMLNVDPPDHTRIRQLVSRGFTPRRVAELAPAVGKRASELVDRIDPARPVDLVAAYAGPLPARVIADLLGVPEVDQEQFRQWSDAMIRPLVAGSPDLTGFRQGRDDLWAYLRAAVEERRREPSDDLIGALVAAEEDDKLEDAELLATCMLLLVAGHETTTNLIANGAWLLLSEPGRVEQFLEAPDIAVEELLRFESPIQGIARVAIEDVELAGTRLPAGSLVSAMIGAANRDPDVFERPESLDLSRTPNPHLAFGNGVHFCLGAALARLEARIALRVLLERFPALQLAQGDPAWRRSVLLRGLERLRVHPAK